MKHLRRRQPSLFGVSARHDIAIGRRWPRWLRCFVVALVLAAVAAATWWMARYVFPPTAPPPTASLTIPLGALGREETLSEELAELRRRNASLESELSMREGSQTTLIQHAETLEQENGQLKEELTYLQKLVADATSEAGAKIQDVRLEPQADRTYRYRILLVQGGNPKDDFEGVVKLLADVGGSLPDGAPQTAPLKAVPGKDGANAPDPAAPLPVKFKYYQRLEGLFRVSDDMKVQQFTVQVFKKGEKIPSIARSINIK